MKRVALELLYSMIKFLVSDKFSHYKKKERNLRKLYEATGLNLSNRQYTHLWFRHKKGTAGLGLQLHWFFLFGGVFEPQWREVGLLSRTFAELRRQRWEFGVIEKKSSFQADKKGETAQRESRNLHRNFLIIPWNVKQLMLRMILYL